MRNLAPLIVALLVGALLPTCEASEYRQVGRYYSVKQDIALEQRDPLLQFVQIKFPESVKTIEAAYRYLLAPTGYNLADFNVIDKKFITLSARRLPLSQRQVNGRVIDILNLMAGHEFLVVRDDLLRVVAIDSRSKK